MHLQTDRGTIAIQSITPGAIRELWELSFGPHADLEWMKFNGPYFNDPVQSRPNFHVQYNQYGVNHPHRGIIYQQNQIVGEVFAHWEDGALQQWLEVGILIYDSKNWGKGIAQQALKLWIPYLFDLHPHIQRVGYTTWSGNTGMMKAGEKIGMTLEAQVRRVRVVDDQYYDSIKYGILREELTGF